MDETADYEADSETSDSERDPREDSNRTVKTESKPNEVREHTKGNVKWKVSVADSGISDDPNQ